MKKQYVQFSKKIVVAVTIMVTITTIACIVLMWTTGQAEYMAQTVKAYISYAMVVFAAYSGNSAVEKWLIKRGPVIHIENDEQDQKEEQQEG